MKNTAAVLLVLCLALLSPALAGAEENAILTIRAALEEAWNKAPLTVQNVTFITEPPQAYGMYQPVKKAVFESIDPILLYCEPMGYTVTKKGEFFHIALAADFSVLNKDGQALGGQNNFYQWKTKSRAFSTEFVMYFTFNLKGLPSGEYTLRIVLRDENSSKVTSFDKKLTIS
ncbi:MAG: hypothetical protein V1816_08000 [Pseudomonadota bacterium]